jgi:hypothetical protein
MHRISLSLALAAGLALAAPMAANAETKPTKPPIDVISFQTAKPDTSKGKGAPAPQATTHVGGGGGAGKVSIQDFHFTQARTGGAGPVGPPPKDLKAKAGDGEAKTALTVRKAGEHQQE